MNWREVTELLTAGSNSCKLNNFESRIQDLNWQYVVQYLSSLLLFWSLDLN